MNAEAGVQLVPTPTPRSTAPTASEPRLHEVSLAQYAAVLAALAEGHDLTRVFAHERIDPEHWPLAEAAWSDRLADAAGTDDGLQTAFDEHLAVAQDRYGRRLPPLDDDLRAFLDFRRRWSLDADPGAMLSQLGVRLDEVARLSRLWSKRIAADPALAAQAQAILCEEPGELPAVTPVVMELPAAPPAARPTVVEEDVVSDEPEQEEPPLFAPLPSWERDEVKAPQPVPRIEPVPPSAPAQIVPAERAVIRAKPSFMRTGAFVAPAPRPGVPLSPPEPAPSAPPVAVARPAAKLGATAAFTLPVRTPALPFAQQGAVASGGATPKDGRIDAGAPPAKEAAAAPRAPLTGTANFDAATLSAVLPFLRSAGTGGQSSDSRPADPAVGRLTLGQYAAFCAEVEAFPDAVEVTFRRYGLTSQRDATEVASAWQQRFAASPGDHQTWQRLRNFFLQQCRTSGRPEIPS